ARDGGRIRPRVAIVKALASATCIGTGGSVGREGPIVQIGSALGSTLGRVVKVAEPRMRVLVACGAAGGIAATFNAPLAGVFFAMELILADFAAQSFGMVVLASVTASVIGRAALGNQPFLKLPPFEVHHLIEYLLFALLGLIAGATGVAFTRILYWIEDACDWGWLKTHGPEWLRPAVGGILLGLVLLVLPEMYGVGYPVLGKSIAGKYAILFLIVLLIGKMIATSLTIGIGGSGGVFAPSLFIGAMLGSAYGQILHHVMPGLAGSAGAYGLIGMGAVFAGAARAPITAVVILFELTGEYSVILPLMAAIALATGVSHLLSQDTIYTLKLRRRGIDLANPAPSAAGTTTVAQVMEPVVDVISDDTTLLEAARALGGAPYGQLPMLDRSGRYRGVVTIRGVTEALAGDDDPATAVATVCELPPSVDGALTLDVAVSALDAAPGPVAVLDPEGSAVIGWLTHRGVLAALVGQPPTRPWEQPQAEVVPA
ncbi:MAG TPA: chloride channel protein, partial [Micromonosporaceae bacterium]